MTTTTTRVKRERPKVIRLSDAAAARILDIMQKSDGRYIGVRVGVKNGGCAGMSYTMDYAESQGPLDEVVEDKGVRILVDPKAVMFLVGTEMDFRREKLAQKFIFTNPNQTEACGCGESVVIVPAKHENT
jgi:iron-sulfur cluster assembly protein